MLAGNKAKQLRCFAEKSKFCGRRRIRGTGHRFVLISKLSVIYFITDGDQDVEEEYWVGTKYKVVENKNVYKPNVKNPYFQPQKSFRKILIRENSACQKRTNTSSKIFPKKSTIHKRGQLQNEFFDHRQPSSGLKLIRNLTFRGRTSA